MNATSLYVSTCRLIILADAADKSSWTDLFRLVPYLRQSLSCTVCGNLLKEPYTPTSSGCQHHVCKKCKGGRKKLKPSCSWCKDYDNYTENLQLRILLQCYKKLCEYFMDTDVYKTLLEEDEIAAGVNGGTVASSGLIDLIQEGAGFTDDYKSTAGLSKSAYSILPCVYTNSASTQTQVASTSTNSEPRTSKDSPNSRATSNGSPMYSVMYAGSGNKITIKRKAVDELDSSQSEPSPSSDSKKSNQLGFKKPSNRTRSSTSNKRKGCRCGNATATPGKLTCCGQRCPCYVESKPCTECKCKGCRNPHRPDGMKVRPHIPQLDLQLTINNNPDSSPSCSGSVDSLDNDTLMMETMEDTMSYSTDLKPDIKVYTTQIQDVSPSLPATILMDDEVHEQEEHEPDNDREHEQENDQEHEQDNDREHEQENDREHEQENDREHEQENDREHEQENDQENEQENDQEHEQENDQEHEQENDQEHEQENDQEHEQENDQEHDQEHEQENDQEHEQENEQEIDQEHEHEDGSPGEDDTSSPQEYALASPQEEQIEEDGEVESPQSNETQENNSDIEVDI